MFESNGTIVTAQRVDAEPSHHQEVLLPMAPHLTTAQRFFAKVNFVGPVPELRPDLGPCWLWTGATGSHGYGHLKVNGRCVLSHRWSYEYVVGTIPHGLESDHLCRVRACVRPTHLEPVTRRENLRRGQGHGSETHCPQDHPYSGKNLYIGPSGWRYCRACRAARR